MAGFEPGSSAPEVDAMSSALRLRAGAENEDLRKINFGRVPEAG
jgi:hypothetical protein